MGASRRRGFGLVVASAWSDRTKSARHPHRQKLPTRAGRAWSVLTTRTTRLPGSRQIETVLVGVGGRRGAGREPELDEDVLEVTSDGVLADAEGLGHLAVGHPRRHDSQHIALPRGERVRPRPDGTGEPARPSEVGARAEALEDRQRGRRAPRWRRRRRRAPGRLERSPRRRVRRRTACRAGARPRSRAAARRWPPRRLPRRARPCRWRTPRSPGRAAATNGRRASRAPRRGAAR